MIHPTTGDLLTAPAEALVNPVNCVGVMGKGLALAFKRAFPAMFEAYRVACEAGEVVPGRMHVWPNPDAPPRYVVNFPTKRHWRSKSRLEDIDAGLVDLVRVIDERKIASIAIPALGAGLGGLAWPDVRRSVMHALEPLEHVNVYLYAPR